MEWHDGYQAYICSMCDGNGCSYCYNGTVYVDGKGNEVRKEDFIDRDDD